MGLGTWLWHGIGNVVGMRDRNAIVLIALKGHRIPAQGHSPGNRIREKRCVLKEHRIGNAVVEVQGPRLCGVT